MTRGSPFSPREPAVAGILTPTSRSRSCKRQPNQHYVLFLIRPNGFESFFEYRQLVLSRAKQPGGAIEHGYEPVNSDSKLVYPN